MSRIGRQKVFSKVKNVNVESAKKRSKLLEFFCGAEEWRVASPPIAISCFTFLTFVTYVTFITYVTFVTNVTYDSLHSCSKFHSHHSRSKSRSRDSCSKQNVGFCVELYSFFVPLLFTYSAGLRRTFHSCFYTLRHRSSPPPRSAKETAPEPILFDWNLALPFWTFHFFRCNK